MIIFDANNTLYSDHAQKRSHCITISLSMVWKNMPVYGLQELMMFMMMRGSTIQNHDHDGTKFTITMNFWLLKCCRCKQSKVFFQSCGVRSGVINKASRATVLLKVSLTVWAWDWERNNTNLYNNYIMNQQLSSTTMSRSPDSKFWVSICAYSFLWLCSVLAWCLGTQTYIKVTIKW